MQNQLSFTVDICKRFPEAKTQTGQPTDYFGRLVTGASRGAESQAASRKGSTASQLSGSESDSRPTTAGDAF
jgi:hypothetical protein